MGADPDQFIHFPGMKSAIKMSVVRASQGPANLRSENISIIDEMVSSTHVGFEGPPKPSALIEVVQASADQCDAELVSKFSSKLLSDSESYELVRSGYLRHRYQNLVLGLNASMDLNSSRQRPQCQKTLDVLSEVNL